MTAVNECPNHPDAHTFDQGDERVFCGKCRKQLSPPIEPPFVLPCAVRTFWFDQGHAAYCEHGLVEGCADDDDACAKLDALTSGHTIVVDE